MGEGDGHTSADGIGSGFTVIGGNDFNVAFLAQLDGYCKFYYSVG